MRTHVVDHPLVAHKLTTLRDERTDSPTFRRLADELVTLLAYEATRDVRVEPVDIDARRSRRATGVRLAQPKPLVVPILRAGLGMLDGMMRLLPTAEVGFLGHGAQRGDARGLDVRRAAARRPAGRQCYVLDPMLATGGTLAAAITLPDRPRRDRHHRDLPAGRARGLSRVVESELGRSTSRSPSSPRPGREAQREGLHRPRPRRRRRPALRRRHAPAPPRRMNGLVTMPGWTWRSAMLAQRQRGRVGVRGP